MEKIIEHGARISILIFDTCFDVAGFLNVIPFSRIPPRRIPQPEEEEIVGGIEMGDVKSEDVKTKGEITETVATEENLEEEVKVETEQETPADLKFSTTRYKKHESLWQLFMFYAIVITELAQMSFVVWRFLQAFARSPKLRFYISS